MTTTDIVGRAAVLSAPEILGVMAGLYRDGTIEWVTGNYLVTDRGADSTCADDLAEGERIIGACIEGVLGLVTGVDTSTIEFMENPDVPDSVKEVERALKHVCASHFREAVATVDDERGLVEHVNDQYLKSKDDAVEIIEAARTLLKQ